MNTYYMNESKRNPYFLCVHRNTLNHKSSSSQKTRPSRSKKRKESLSFFLSFFLSLCLCEWWCRRHEQKLQRHARGDARVRGTVEVLLPRKRTGFEILRDRFALVERERRDDETRPGRVHDEETTVLEMQTRTNGHANAHTRK